MEHTVPMMKDIRSRNIATREEDDKILKWINGWNGEPDIDMLLKADPGIYTVLLSAMRMRPGYYPKNDEYGASMDDVIYGGYPEVVQYFRERLGEEVPKYDEIITDPEHWIVTADGFIRLGE